MGGRSGGATGVQALGGDGGDLGTGTGTLGRVQLQSSPFSTDWTALIAHTYLSS